MDAELYLKARHYLVKNLPSANTKVISRWIETYLYELLEQGWNRGHLYNMLSDIAMHTYSLNEDALDAVNDIQTFLTGHCLSSLIKPFPGEPEDHEELVGYVRGGEWQETRLDVWGVSN